MPFDGMARSLPNWSPASLLRGRCAQTKNNSVRAPPLLGQPHGKDFCGIPTLYPTHPASRTVFAQQAPFLPF